MTMDGPLPPPHSPGGEPEGGLRGLVPSASLRAPRPDRPAIVLVPGTGGSRMVDTRTNRIVWGSFWNVFGRVDDLRLAVPLSCDPAAPLELPVTPAGWLDAIPLPLGLGRVRFYGHLTEFLVRQAGYRLGDIHAPEPEDDLFVYSYDWRQDPSYSARALKGALDRIRRARGRPELRFVLIGHSTGGTVVRWFTRYGDADPLAVSGPPARPLGAEYLHRSILLGSACRGTVDTFYLASIGYHTTTFGHTYNPYAMATLPSLYTGLPSGTGHFVDQRGNALDAGGTSPLDVYDVETWRRLRLGFFSPRAGGLARRAGVSAAVMESFLVRALARARLVRDRLDAPGPDEYVILASGAHPSPARILVTASNDLRFQTRGSVSLELPGDAYATLDSLRGRRDDGLGEPSFRIHRQVLAPSIHRWLMKDPLILAAIVEEAAGVPGGAPASPPASPPP